MSSRRQFITLLGGAAAWPIAAWAQQVPVIGFLRTTEAAGSAHLVDAFRQGLGEAGFVEGRNVVIEYRWADDRHGRLDELAADLVRRGVAAIVGNSRSVRAAMAATSATPLIFVVGNDPVRTGLVDTLNRPGGNVTGVTFTTLDLVAKQIGLMNELGQRFLSSNHIRRLRRACRTKYG
jgi:putative ABC transport system substrate-binding protein